VENKKIWQGEGGEGMRGNDRRGKRREPLRSVHTLMCEILKNAVIAELI